MNSKTKKMNKPATIENNQIRVYALPSLALADGTVEAIKWLALGLMTLDHANKYIFHDAYSVLFNMGRLTMPLFGFVLAYNLARPGTLKNGVHLRVIKRLLLFGTFATVPFILIGRLSWGWFPLNIMLMLAVSTGCIYLSEKGASRLALLTVFFVGGALVEFWWPAVAMCLYAWAYCKRPSWLSLLLWIASTAALFIINGNFWALAAFPLIFMAPHIQIRIPRMKSVFYAYYPAHLAVVWALLGYAG